MATNNAFAEVTRDWKAALDAARLSPDVQPEIEKEVQALAQSLDEVEGLKARQDELKALRQQTTQQLLGAIARGKEAVMRLRAVVKGKIGPRSERLVHFRVAPLRKRSPRKPAEKPPDGESPGTGPGTVASPPARPVE